MTTKAQTTIETPAAAARTAKASGYVKGSHAARVRSEHDERRVELLSLRDVLSAQRDGLNDQIDDIANALMLLSEPSEFASNIVAMAAE
jgi:hypothetical protein